MEEPRRSGYGRAVPILLALALAGCGPGPEAPANVANVPPPVAGDPQGSGTEERPYVEEPVAGGGTIAGRVILSGEPPPRRRQRVDRDAGACGTHEIESEELVVGSDRGLRWAVVRLEQIARGKPLASLGRARIDNRGCVFVPHVALTAVNAEVELRNSDPVAHTMDAYPRRNTLGLQLAGGGSATTRFEYPEVIHVECQIHKWMSCFLWVCEHPYYAVTGADGRFELADVPPGRYIVRAWAERFDDELAREVTVEPGRRAEVEFEFAIR